MGPSVTGGTMVVAGMIQLHTLYPAVKRRKNDMTGQAPLRRPPCFMTGSRTLAVVLAACVLMTAATAQDSLPDYSAIIASPARCGPADRQAARSCQATGIHCCSPRHEGAGYGRGRWVQHGIDGARGCPERCGVRSKSCRSRRACEDEVRSAAKSASWQKYRELGAAVRRSGALRRARLRPHHIFVFLPRYHVHDCRPR